MLTFLIYVHFTFVSDIGMLLKFVYKPPKIADKVCIPQTPKPSFRVLLTASLNSFPPLTLDDFN